MNRWKQWVGQGGQEAVSPVVGSILILVIMIMSIGGIVAFGVPIINGLQDYAEFQNVVTQFQELDGDVRNLRDPQNVRISSVSINKGEIDLSRGDRWVITVINDGETPFRVTGWEQDEDGIDDEITVDWVRPGGDLTQFYVHQVRGSTFTQLGSFCNEALPCTHGLTDLTDVVLRVSAKLNNVIWGEAWIMDMGRLSFEQSASSDLNQVHYQMGAVMTQQNDAFFIQQVPTIKEPDTELDDDSLFIRALRLQVDDPNSQNGQGRHTVITNLVDNYGEARGRPAYSSFAQVRIQIDGVMESAFCQYFSDRADRGWDLDVDGSTVVEDDEDCVTTATDKHIEVIMPGPARFDMIHSEVDTDLRKV